MKYTILLLLGMIQFSQTLTFQKTTVNKGFCIKELSANTLLSKKKPLLQ